MATKPILRDCTERYNIALPFNKTTIFKHREYRYWVVGGYGRNKAWALLFPSYKEAVSFVQGRC